MLTKIKHQYVISIFDDFYNSKDEKDINLNQLLSLYTKVNFTTQRDIDSLLEFSIGKDKLNSKYEELKKDLETKYSFLKNVDISKITISNMWDFLDELNKKYGNSFILTSIKIW